jgi:hypothetical protein
VTPVPSAAAAILRRRLLIAATLVLLEIAFASALGAFDPGARLLAGGSTASLAVFALGAFFCLRFVVYFVLPPALAFGLVALVLPRTDLRDAIRAAQRLIRDRRLRRSRIVAERRLG